MKKRRPKIDTSGRSVLVLSANFTLAELTFSQTAARMHIDNTPSPTQVSNLRALCVNVLQPFRETAQAPVVVSSGFRSEALNRFVNGSPDSQHMRGEAADIVVPQWSVTRAFRLIVEQSLPFDQLIFEGGSQSQWVHVSHSRKRQRGDMFVAKFPVAGGVHYQRLTRAEALQL